MSTLDVGYYTRMLNDPSQAPSGSYGTLWWHHTCFQKTELFYTGNGFVWTSRLTMYLQVDIAGNMNIYVYTHKAVYTCIIIYTYIYMYNVIFVNRLEPSLSLRLSLSRSLSLSIYIYIYILPPSSAPMPLPPDPVCGPLAPSKPKWCGDPPRPKHRRHPRLPKSYR